MPLKWAKSKALHAQELTLQMSDTNNIPLPQNLRNNTYLRIEPLQELFFQNYKAPSIQWKSEAALLIFFVHIFHCGGSGSHAYASDHDADI